MSEDVDKPRGGMFGRLLGGQKPAVAEPEPLETSSRPPEVSGDDPRLQTEDVTGDAREIAGDVCAHDGDAPSLELEPDTSDGAIAGSSAAKKSWFSKLRDGLSKTSSRLSEGITGLFTKKKLDPETLEDFEDLLIQADLGLETAGRITRELAKGRVDKGLELEEVREVLVREVARVLEPVAARLETDPSNTPHVIVVVGVNGTGKTTTIGKLAAKLRAERKSVMLAAGDTFRAAAIDQLKIWGDRTGSPVIARDVGADSAGLAFDAVKAAKSQNCDVVLIDTAGRLQNKSELMEELEKVVRVIGKIMPDAPHEVLLVLDATTGQNAMQQVEVFRERAGVTGIVMTKLDGTARGGILVAIAAKYGLPVYAIGVGEGVDDLQPFDAHDFASAIAAG